MGMTSDLQSLVNSLKQKENQTLTAARQRLEALQRISSDFATLKKNPSDNDTKNRLSGDLETERKYLKIIRDHSREISDLLGISSNEVKRIQKSNKNNQKITGDLNTLNDILNELKIIFKYIERKIDLIQTRVKEGDTLLKGKSTYHNVDITSGSVMLFKEQMADEQIIEALNGGEGIQARTKWQRVKYMLALDIKPRPGVNVLGLFSNIRPNELPKELKLIAEMILLVFRFFEIFANYEISSEQKEK